MSIASSSFMVEQSRACAHVTVRHRTVVVSIEVEVPVSSPMTSETHADRGDDATVAAVTPPVVWALVLPKRELCFADGFYTAVVPVPLGVVSWEAGREQLRPKTRNHRGDGAGASRGAPVRRAVLSLGRWELTPGSRVALLLADAEAPVASVQSALEQVLGMPPKLREAATGTATSPSPPSLQTSVVVSTSSTTWRLCGSQVATEDQPEEREWQPLLHRRWYELKSYVREGTVVPYYTSSSASQHRRGHESDTSDSPKEDEEDEDDDSSATDDGGSHTDASSSSTKVMYAGDVKEADAISVNRQCIMWTDGVVGLLDEVKPFYRVYQPARKEKTIRVRRFPHRYADVVGEVPFEQAIEACGRATDPYTQEQYVLVYLPSGPTHASHIATYDLSYVEEGRCVWGWSKLAGSSGLPLLVEVQHGKQAGRSLESRETDKEERAEADNTRATTTASSSIARRASAVAGGAATREGGGTTDAASRATAMPLPEATFYTPVREGRAVRIRKRPTLTSATVREMEANEVRAAVALVTAPVPLSAADGSSKTAAAVPLVFVKWQQGGYSLLRNATECFLAPVQLSHAPRRFPIRTRTHVPTDPAEPEIIDLSQPHRRKRARQTAGATGAEDDTDAELEKVLHARKSGVFSTEDDTLLSPCALPASLQDALHRGVVRLEDLPPLQQLGEAEASSASKGSSEDGFSDDSSFDVDGFSSEEEW